MWKYGSMIGPKKDQKQMDEQFLDPKKPLK